MKGAKGAKAFESSSKTKPRVAEHSFAASDFSCFICSRIRLIYQRDKSSTTKFSSARAAATISYFSRFFVTVDKTSLHFNKIHLFITSFGLDLEVELPSGSSTSLYVRQYTNEVHKIIRKRRLGSCKSFLRINTLPFRFRHFLAFLIQHQAER